MCWRFTYIAVVVCGYPGAQTTRCSKVGSNAVGLPVACQSTDLKVLKMPIHLLLLGVSLQPWSINEKISMHCCLSHRIGLCCKSTLTIDKRWVAPLNVRLGIAPLVCIVEHRHHNVVGDCSCATWKHRCALVGQHGSCRWDEDGNSFW